MSSLIAFNLGIQRNDFSTNVIVSSQQTIAMELRDYHGAKVMIIAAGLLHQTDDIVDFVENNDCNDTSYKDSLAETLPEMRIFPIVIVPLLECGGGQKEIVRWIK